LSGANSYRKTQKFMVAHYDTLNEIFELNWKRMPAHTSIRDIIQGTSGSELEQSFRQYSQALAESDSEKQVIGCDGKVLRGSFDHFKDQKAIQILSAFVNNSRLILAHEEIATKTNEIPTAQKLMTELGLSGLKKPVMRPLSKSKGTKKHCSMIVRPSQKQAVPMKFIKSR
jgi:hypothetical protein